MTTSKKSAKDWYSEKYPGDYQKDEVPDKPIDKLTDKDIEHLDTQVRELLMKEKKRVEDSKTSKVKATASSVKKKFKDLQESESVATEWQKAFDDPENEEGLYKFDDELSEAQRDANTIARYAESGKKLAEGFISETRARLEHVAATADNYGLSTTAEFIKEISSDLKKLEKDLRDSEKK